MWECLICVYTYIIKTLHHLIRHSVDIVRTCARVSHRALVMLLRRLVSFPRSIYFSVRARDFSHIHRRFVFKPLYLSQLEIISSRTN